MCNYLCLFVTLLLILTSVPLNLSYHFPFCFLRHLLSHKLHPLGNNVCFLPQSPMPFTLYQQEMTEYGLPFPLGEPFQFGLCNQLVSFIYQR